jgi:hypothetical protein
MRELWQQLESFGASSMDESVVSALAPLRIFVVRIIAGVPDRDGFGLTFAALHKEVSADIFA